MDITLRTVQPVQPVVDKVVEPKTDTEPVVPRDTSTMPPSLRVEALREPFVVDVLNLKAGYGTLNTEYLAKKIDSYVIEELKMRGLKDTEESYKDVVNEWSNKLKLTPETDIYTKLERLKDFAEVNDTIREKVNERENLLHGDPLRMTTTQLKRYLNG